MFIGYQFSITGYIDIISTDLSFRDSYDWLSSIKSIEDKEMNVCVRLRVSAAKK